MTPTSPTAATPGAEPTHGCARCGAPVAADVGLCERCNPLGLRDVASSQVHGSVFVAVALAVVILAVVARLAVSGVGPFPATLVAASPLGDALVVTLTVANHGSSSGRTTCRVYDPADQGGGPSAFVLSPPIGAGQTITFESTVSAFGGGARALAVACRTP